MGRMQRKPGHWLRLPGTEPGIKPAPCMLTWFSVSASSSGGAVRNSENPDTRTVFEPARGSSVWVGAHARVRLGI